MVLKKASYSVDPSNGLILAGDFNFTPNGDLFAFLKKTLDIEVSVLDSEVKHSANFPDQDLFSVQGNPVWIDFILLRQSQWLEQTRIWIEEPRERKGEIWTRISDHNPITSIFQLTEFEH
jgi:endonuclease/exonuclease/phosphatase family metal-dependent hydrolase